MNLRISITNEEPARPNGGSSNEPIIELLRQLEVGGRWGKVSGLPDENRVAAIQSAANYHGTKLSKSGDWGVITRSQRESDGTYSVFIRKVSKAKRNAG